MKLHVKASVMTETQLKALWVVLDADASNQIQMDEFSRFLRGKSGQQAGAERPTRPKKKSSDVGEAKLSPEQEERLAARAAKEKQYRQNLNALNAWERASALGDISASADMLCVDQSALVVAKLLTNFGSKHKRIECC